MFTAAAAVAVLAALTALPRGTTAPSAGPNSSPSNEQTVAAEPAASPSSPSPSPSPSPPDLTAAGTAPDSATFATARAALRAFPAQRPIVRGVYSTRWSWAGDRWNELMRLVRTTEINAVVIDVKDDAGELAYDSNVELAGVSGADQQGTMSWERAAERIRELRRAGGYPIARIVCFKDSYLPVARPDLAVIHSGTGQPWRDGKDLAWLNPRQRETWDYLVELGREAHRMGFLEVQFDYVRFPTDGDTDAATYPGTPPGEPPVAPRVIREFLRYSRRQLHGSGIRVSADIFGLTTYKAQGQGDGDGTGQLFEDVIDQVDYVSPMVYPSHYYPGNYGLDDPESSPYEVVSNAMREAQVRVAGHRADVRPWLEDFSLTVPHTPERVSAQLRATYEQGIESWLLWNAGNRYSESALEAQMLPRAAPPPTPPPPPSPDPEPPTVEPSPTSPPSPSEVADLDDTDLRRMDVNELGRVLVLEYHDISDSAGRWQTSRATFEAQLQELYDRGYRPITTEEFAAGTFPIPAGTSPVLLTFDDSFASHFAFGPDGKTPAPDSVVGILERFAREHDDWRATAVFYVYWPVPFRDSATVDAKIAYLAEHGFEIGNHSYQHENLAEMDAAGVQESLGRLQAVVEEIVPGYRLRSLALPFGVFPEDRSLAVRGSWQGTGYEHDLILMVGFMPTRSPHHVDFDPLDVQRVQAHVPEFRTWVDWLSAEPGRRFVSDGDPDTVTYPSAFADVAQPRPGFEVRTYRGVAASG